MKKIDEILHTAYELLGTGDGDYGPGMSPFRDNPKRWRKTKPDTYYTNMRLRRQRSLGQNTVINIIQNRIHNV